VFALIAVVFPAAADSGVKQFVLDTSVRHQVMDNFGANDAWTLHKIGAEWSEKNKNKIADLLYSTNTGIGLTFARLYLPAGLNHETIRERWRTAETFEVTPGKYDWTRLPGERWFICAAKERGVMQFGMTVYSPPLRLTRNGLSNLGNDTNSTTNLKPGAEDDFAGYLADILKHFRDQTNAAERVDFNFVLPVNEPQWEWQRKQEGNRASNDDLKKIFRAVKRRFDRDGVATKILGPESGSIPDMTSLDEPARDKWGAEYGDYLKWICGDPEIAAGFGGIISYHSYWSDEIPEKLVPHRETLGRAFTNFPNWKIWQSEYCIMEAKRDLGMDAALRMARIIHCDLTLVNASAWQWWLAVSAGDYKDGLICTDYHRPGDAETIYESKLLWALGNFSRFIRPGMVRVELSGPQNVQGLMASAYLDEKTGRTILVFVNVAATAQKVRLQFAPTSRATTFFTPFFTTTKQNLASGKKIEAAKMFFIPPRSVVTLAGE
jgi:O-glycosyl hydrolase